MIVEGQRKAIVIATSTYRYLPNLPFSAEDAAGLAAILRSPYLGMCDTEVLINMPSDRVKSALEHMFRQAESESEIILYFSGHAIQDGYGQVSWATVDTDPNLPLSTGIHSQMLEVLQSRSKCGHVGIMLDCCFGGAFTPTASSEEEIADIRSVFGHDTCILTATDAVGAAYAPAEAVPSSPARSLFTKYVIEGVDTGHADLDGDGYIKLSELHKYVSDRLSTHGVEQSPQYWGTDATEGMIISKTPDVGLFRPTESTSTSVIEQTCDLIVGGDSPGAYSSISTALEASKPGDVIGILEGVYAEALILDKAVSLRGLGRPRKVVITTDNDVTIRCRSGGAISNLTVKQRGIHAAVKISDAGGSVEDCNIEADFGTCIEIDAASARVVTSRIVGGQDGILTIGSPSVLVKNSELFKQNRHGVFCERSQLHAVSNQIYGNRQVGVYLVDESGGKIEKNEIFGNRTGVEIWGDSDPAVFGNAIRDNEQGVRVTKGGRGNIRGNDIYENRLSGIHVTDESRPEIRKNTIRENSDNGVRVSDNASPAIFDNDVFHNGMSGLSLLSQSKCRAEGNRLFLNSDAGIRVAEESNCEIDDNDIYENGLSGVIVLTGSSARIEQNRIYNCKEMGIAAKEGSFLDCRRNELFQNHSHGISLKESVGDMVGNIVRQNGECGVQLSNSKRVLLERNKISGSLTGVHAEQASIALVENDLRENRVGVECEDSEVLTFVDNSIVGNSDVGVFLVRSNLGQHVTLRERNKFAENGRRDLDITE